MASEENIKTIIADFLNISVDQINENTVIDKQSLRGSIMVNRLFSILKSEGLEIDDYSKFQTFGDLKNFIKNPDNTSAPVIRVIHREFNNSSYPSSEIGIDIQNINKMPDAIDFREDVFYKQNFSSREIAYCILKSNPKESFAGLFAVKEAIIKADSNLRNAQFSDIEILHNPDGKPTFESFSISISHSDNLAIGVAYRLNPISNSNQSINNPTLKPSPASIPLIYKIFILLAFLLSLTTLVIYLFKI